MTDAEPNYVVIDMARVTASEVQKDLLLMARSFEAAGRVAYILICDEVLPKKVITKEPLVAVLEAKSYSKDVLSEKNDSIHWNSNRQRNLRGRQHQRLIFQRTTNK